MKDGRGPVDGLREVCHDIRQPIAGVLALAAAVLAETDLSEQTRSRLEQMIELAEWQSDIVENWLDAEGDSSPSADDTDANRGINEAAAAERLIWTGNLTLIWPSERVFIRLDPVILRRMTANLLDNATRAAGPAGTVTVGISRLDDQMLLVVEDDGPGFGWLAGGRGLGLSPVGRRAVQHGGRLECGRGSPGGGRGGLRLAPAGTRVKREGGTVGG